MAVPRARLKTSDVECRCGVTLFVEEEADEIWCQIDARLAELDIEIEKETDAQVRNSLKDRRRIVLAIRSKLESLRRHGAPPPDRIERRPRRSRWDSA